MSGIFEDVARLRDGSGGDETVPVRVIEPDGDARGGIVVLHEARDLTAALDDLMRAVAAEGFIAVVPNLFHRDDADDAAEVFGDNLFADFDACFDWLVQRGVLSDCIGVLGFDDAGTAALLVATSRPVGAAVSVAARGIVTPITADAPALVSVASSVQAPWLGLYGVDDPETPPEHVDLLRDALAGAPVATNVVSYSGEGHRADEGAVINEGGTEVLVDAQTRIFDWFGSFLR